jgi:hypothetical protein
MVLNLQIADDEEHVFEFDNFELVLHSSGNYILSEEGVFTLEGLQSFLEFNSEYVVVNENDKLFISAEDFKKVKEIYLKFA